jgi:hypothetical protein
MRAARSLAVCRTDRSRRTSLGLQPARCPCRHDHRAGVAAKEACAGPGLGREARSSGRGCDRHNDAGRSMPSRAGRPRASLAALAPARPGQTHGRCAGMGGSPHGAGAAMAGRCRRAAGRLLGAKSMAAISARQDRVVAAAGGRRLKLRIPGHGSRWDAMRASRAMPRSMREQVGRCQPAPHRGVAGNGRGPVKVRPGPWSPPTGRPRACRVAGRAGQRRTAV